MNLPAHPAASSFLDQRLSAWLKPAASDARHLRGWRYLADAVPVRLRGAAPEADWPDAARLAAWMQAERLRSDDALLWRGAAARDAAALPIDPRSWTRERRLGDQVLGGLLDAARVERELAAGGWLQLRHVHRVDAGVAGAMSAAQRALGVPLRAHAWRGQAVGGRPLHLGLPALLPGALRVLVVLAGTLTVSWQDEAVGARAAPRSLKGEAGDVLILPALPGLGWRTAASVWALEFEVLPLTPLDLLRDLGEAALQSLRDDPALRRCAGALPAAVPSDLQRLAEAVRAQPRGRVVHAVRRHHARLDEDSTARTGRLSALSRLLEADARTRLVGHPERLLQRRQDGGRLTLTLARKELHFDARAAELLDFMLQPEPYQLADAPGRHALAERLQLARSLAVEGLVGVC